MEKYIEIIINSYKGYANYLWQEVTNPSYHNYFYWLIAVSVFFFALEIVIPWRKNQPIIRKNFYLDAFYMFFNFFLFSLIIYNAIGNIGVELFTTFLKNIGVKNLVAIQLNNLPNWSQLLILFILKDFIHFNVHRLLHRFDFLWQFHKVHHSIQQMGFAGHLRYHWMENVVYKTLEFLPLTMIGFGIDDFFIVHIIGLSIGHFNHSNINIPLGPLKYVFNSPQMHIWHHAEHIPTKNGVNFGISLSVWDYLFKTDYIPKDGRDEPLGFDNMKEFPVSSFWKQAIFPWKK